jgi:aspartate/methionine/tyrosine aminotransferase
MGRALAGRVPGYDSSIGDRSSSPELLDLTRPQPQETAAPVREAAKAALERGETHYTARAGIPPLRQAIATSSSADGFPATAESTVVTNGGTEALYIALQTTLQPGGRALLFEPVAPGVIDVARFIGAQPILVADIGDAHLEDSDVILVLAPSALSGVAVPDDRLSTLLEAAWKQDVTVIVDRSAAPDRYQPAPPFPRPDLAAEVITVGSFSGSYGLAGWRVGYFTSPPDGMERLDGLKESMSICTTTVAQFAALAAMEHADELLARERERFAGRRDTVIQILAASGIPVIQPDVYPALLIDIRQSGMDDRRFAQRLASEAGVVVEPGSLFGESLAGHVRINLGAEETLLVEGVTRLASFVEAG